MVGLDAIEDLHWADETTEETLKWLLESTPRARVLVIFTYRPEFEHTWGCLLISQPGLSEPAF